MRGNTRKVRYMMATHVTSLGEAVVGSRTSLGLLGALLLCFASLVCVLRSIFDHHTRQWQMSLRTPTYKSLFTQALSVTLPHRSALVSGLVFQHRVHP